MLCHVSGLSIERHYQIARSNFPTLPTTGAHFGAL